MGLHKKSEGMTELEKLEITGCNTFRGTPTGYITKPNGGRKYLYKYENYRKTRGYGEITEKEWTERTMKAVEENGVKDLYDAIRKHMDENIYFLKEEEEKKTYALECLMLKLYEHWKDFAYREPEETIIWL